jgi:hypothetical protein
MQRTVQISVIWRELNAMSDYAFRAGQLVDYLWPIRYKQAADGLYQITACLPTEHGEHRYRIKSPLEGYERVAKESELRRAASGHQTQSPSQHSPAAHSPRTDVHRVQRRIRNRLQVRP